MENRYENMKLLRDHLDELFKLCGIQTKRVKVQPAPKLLRLAERLIQDEALCDYLKGLDTQAEKAIQEMKERQLDAWDNAQNETRIEEMEAELIQKQEQAEELRQTLVQKQERIDALEECLRQTREQDERCSAGQMTLVQDLIALRDKLLLRKSWLEDQDAENENARKVVDSQLRETARCLANAGVEILDAGGAFDSSYQSVVETHPAEDEKQVDQIMETFRPGYRFQGEVLRPQEVVLFVKMQR